MSNITARSDECHFILVGALIPLCKTIIMFGNLSVAEIDAFIHRQGVGHLGCHADGKTYVVPVSYAYDGKYIYGHTEEGLKINIMRKNPNVCLEVDEIINMANWKSAICWGKFEELTDEESRNEGLKKLLERPLPFIASKTVILSPVWPFPPSDYSLIGGVVYRILVEEKSGRFESGHDEAHYER